MTIEEQDDKEFKEWWQSIYGIGWEDHNYLQDAYETGRRSWLASRRTLREKEKNES